jgi:hypothetical protein
VSMEEVLEVGVSDLGIWDTFVGQTRGNEGDIASHFTGLRFGYFLWSSDHKSWSGLGLSNPGI